MKEQDSMVNICDDQAPSAEAGLFGLEAEIKDSKIVLIPVPWDVTASYGKGASDGPQGVLQASHQLDLEDPFFGPTYKKGINLEHEDQEIKQLNHDLNSILRAQPISSSSIEQVNRGSKKINYMLEKQCSDLLSSGKLVGVLGGDHSSPFGLIKALSKLYPDFGILHIDAHFDLRVAYEGFEHSHASIMQNVLKHCPQVSKLVQVGIRDYCDSEMNFASGCEKVIPFLDNDLFNRGRQCNTKGYESDSI